MRRTAALATILVIVSSALAGCGTYVPEIQEIGQSSEDAQDFVHAIVTNIDCELQDAFFSLHQGYKKGTFLDSWGVQTTLILTFDEKGSLSANAIGMPPSPASAIFSIAGGVNGSSEATRTEKLNYYGLIKDIYNKTCSPKLRGGPFILQSDLKLREWLFDIVQENNSNNVNLSHSTDKGPLKENVTSHEVKFEIISSGTITPSWKLTRASVNSTGSFLTASRDRTQDLIITIGPPDSVYTKVFGKDKKVRSARVNVAAPSEQAAQIHFSALIGAAVTSGVRAGFQP